MDDQEIMQQENDSGETDGFLDGWEETTPASEEFTGRGESGDGGDQAAQEIGAEDPAHAQETAGGEQQPKGTGLGRPDGEVPGQTGGENEGSGDPQRSDGDQTAQQEPRMWKLNHLGQMISANEADMVTLAQKGLDYDRIRSEYDEAKPVMALFREFAGRAGMELGDYLTHIRAQAKQAEGLSEAEARRTVALEDREAAVSAREESKRQQEAIARQEMARQQAMETRMQTDLLEFRETFPEAAQNPASIPREVWEAVRGGKSLVAAYARYSISQAAQTAAEAKKAAVQRQNEENAARSVGSMRSAGADAASKDPFLEGWNE